MQITDKASSEAVSITLYPCSDRKPTEHVLNTSGLHSKQAIMTVSRYMLSERCSYPRSEGSLSLSIAFAYHSESVTAPVYIISLNRAYFTEPETTIK